MDLDQVMTPCAYIHVLRDMTIHTCAMHIATKFAIIDESHVRLYPDARWHDINIRAIHRDRTLPRLMECTSHLGGVGTIHPAYTMIIMRRKCR